MRVLLIPFEIALLLARIPLDLRHRRLAELLALPASVPLLLHVYLRQPNTQGFMIQGMAVAATPGAKRTLHRALRQARESDGSCAPASVSSALGRHPPHRQPLCVVAATASDAQIH